MSLIVGRIENTQIKFISDSKITDESKVRNNPLTGNLKTWILTHLLCVSFAGKTYFAEKFLEKYYGGELNTFQELLYYLLQLNNESNNDTDFCVGTLFGNRPKLYKISNRKIEENLKTVWIGDKRGFSRYQEAFHKLNSNNPFEKMEKAFEEVIKDEAINTIDDFQIPVETVFHKRLNSWMFIYGFKSFMTVAPQTIKISSNDPYVPINFGSPEIGSYGTSYPRSINVGKSAIAIHFPIGKFGILFCPSMDFIEPQILKIEDGEDFANEVFRKYGIALEGMVAKDNFAMKYIITKNLP